MHESGECLQSLDCFVLVILYELLGYAVFLKTVDLNASGERIGAGIVAVAAVEDELLAGILTSGEDILELACLVLGNDSLVVYEIVAVIVGLGIRITASTVSGAFISETVFTKATSERTFASTSLLRWSEAKPNTSAAALASFRTCVPDSASAIAETSMLVKVLVG